MEPMVYYVTRMVIRNDGGYCVVHGPVASQTDAYAIINETGYEWNVKPVIDIKDSGNTRTYEAIYILP